MQPSHIILTFLILLAFVFIINYTVQHIGIQHNKENPGTIYDVVWKYGPDLSKHSWLHEVVLIGIIISLFILPITDSILKEFLIKFTIVMLVRALTTISTILPKDESCDETIGLHTFISGGCYDKVFSGHTAFVTMFTLIFLDKSFISTLQFWLINIINMAFIVLTRGHYTIDVILGFIISYLVYDGNYLFIHNVLKKIKLD